MRHYPGEVNTNFLILSEFKEIKIKGEINVGINYKTAFNLEDKTMIKLYLDLRIKSTERTENLQYH